MEQSPVKTGMPKYYLLYLPSLVALMLSGSPVTGYLAAWLGSFFIFYVSFTNKVKPTSPDIPLAEKILKPLFLTQIIFAGYMSCTSIFYFLNLMGYQNFEKVYGLIPSMDEVAEAAVCQRFYLLGHAAFAHGLLLAYRPDIQSAYQPKINNWPAFFIRVAVVTLPAGIVLKKLPGLSVMGNSIEGLSLVAATIAFALAIPLKKTGQLIISGGIYGALLVQTLTSGFKEPVIVSILMLGLFLYPFYKRLITFTFLPILLLLFTILPTYVNTFRAQKTNSSADSETAKEEAIKKLKEDLDGDALAKTNWEFLTNRISEIGMFVKYKESTEERGSYYGVQILAQSALALVPRLVWKTKPITEDMVMVRTIENGIVSENSEVSAKPQYIVDGYLSAGIIGIWLALFFYGAAAQFFNNWSEKLFGGYIFGTVFVYTGMFRALWRGNCFEFIFNSMFYSFLGLFALFFVFKKLGVLVAKEKGKIKEAHPEAAVVPALEMAN